MQINPFVGTVLVALTVTGAGAVKAETKSFENAVESYYKEEFQTFPVLATQMGVHDYDAEIDDLSREGQARNAAHLHKALDAISAIDPSSISLNDRDDREALISSIKAKLLDVETIRYWRKDPNVYQQTATSAVFHLVVRDFAPLEDRLRSVIARERKIPALLAAGKVNVEHAPRAFVEIALRNVVGSINFLRTDTPAAFAAAKDQGLKREFAAATDAAVAAFEDFRAYLDQELKPKADGEFALGPDLFAQSLALNEMIEISPDRLAEIAYTQLRKDQSALSDAAQKVDPVAPVEAVLNGIRSQHPTAGGLIATAKDDLARLRAFVIDHHIATIPENLLPDVEETPEFLRATTAAAIDLPGPLEKRATRAFYYVTPPDPGLAQDKLEQYLQAYSFPGLEIISLHEVWPGHFMQYLARRAHPEWSLARKMAQSYSTAEGWAHYTEQMMLEEGLGDSDPKLKIAQLQWALLRDCRVVAAIEMHTKNRTLDDAAQIFTKECGSPEPEARREAYRGTRDPGYINYTVGKLAILKLRYDYRAKMGNRFSLTEFHDQLLAAGLTPIKIIRRELLGDDSPVL
jgi:uncharacterized protein (DUF885 family)